MAELRALGWGTTTLLLVRREPREDSFEGLALTCPSPPTAVPPPLERRNVSDCLGLALLFEADAPKPCDAPMLPRSAQPEELCCGKGTLDGEENGLAVATGGPAEGGPRDRTPEEAGPAEGGPPMGV